MGSMAESLARGHYGWHYDDRSEADAHQMVHLVVPEKARRVYALAFERGGLPHRQLSREGDGGRSATGRNM
jgi:hypothetical protein